MPTWLSGISPGEVSALHYTRPDINCKSHIFTNIQRAHLQRIHKKGSTPQCVACIEFWLRHQYHWHGGDLLLLQMKQISYVEWESNPHLCNCEASFLTIRLPQYTTKGNSSINKNLTRLPITYINTHWYICMMPISPPPTFKPILWIIIIMIVIIKKQKNYLDFRRVIKWKNDFKKGLSNTILCH